MKALVTALMLVFASFAALACEPAKKEPAKIPDNCVKKDKDGKCPAAPSATKPTPKKKVEEAKKS